jgi:superfamily II DNA or RNA helicase
MDNNTIQKTMENIEIRDVFTECYSKICYFIKNKKEGKKLIHAFCGVGKSRVMYKSALSSFCFNATSLVVIVFPTIALVTQFNSDYIGEETGKKFNVMSVCSRNELNKIQDCNGKTVTDKNKYKNISFTTETDKISSFVNKRGYNFVCCTYQSLKTLVSALGDNKVDVCLFDEAHRSESLKNKEIIYDTPCFYSLGLFFTATPSDKMKKELERICYIPYFNALEKGYLKKFDLRVDIGIKPENGDNKTLIYESIARCILETGDNKVMTFHSFSNNKKEDGKTFISDDSSSEISAETELRLRTSVKTFASEKLFKKSFKKILNTEFPLLSNKYRKITVKPCTAETTNREKLLNKFDSTLDDEIFILCSCKTLGEGVDTKKANMCVFADPKNSYKDIIQNIGRILRQKPNENLIGTVLIPILINPKPFNDCKTLDDTDETLRKEINESGDFNGILNVVSALKQDNEEYFNNCLIYPRKYMPEKVKNSIKKTGKKEYKKSKKLSEVLPEELEKPEICDNEEEYLKEICEKNKVKLEFITDDVNNHRTLYEPEEKDDEMETLTICKVEDDYILYKTDEECDDDSKDETDEEKDDDDDTNETDYKKKMLKEKIRIKVHTNPEFKVLWGIKDDQLFNNAITSAVIDCVVESDKSLDEKWEEQMQQVLEYKKKTGKLPAVKDKENGGNFLSHQKGLYKCFKNNLKGPKMLESRVSRFEEYCKELEIDLVDFLKEERTVRKSFEEWKQECIEIMKKLKIKKPNNHSKDPKESSIGRWITKQLVKLDKLKPEQRKFIEQFKSRDKEEKWVEKMQQIIEYKQEKGKLPTVKDKENNGIFLARQKTNYKRFKNNLKGKKMKESRVARFEEYCKELEIDLVELLKVNSWEEQMQQVLEYKKKNGKIPLSKDLENGGKFLNFQKCSYKCFKKNLKGRKMLESNVDRFEEYCKELEIDLVELLKEEKTEDKYKCVCGSLMTNNTTTINKHKNTKKHKDYLTKLEK